MMFIWDLTMDHEIENYDFKNLLNNTQHDWCDILKNYKMIFVPMHLTNHWILGVFNMVKIFLELKE